VLRATRNVVILSENYYVILNVVKNLLLDLKTQTLRCAQGDIEEGRLRVTRNVVILNENYFVILNVVKNLPLVFISRPFAALRVT